MKIETFRPTPPPAKEWARASKRPGLLWPLLGLLAVLSGGGFMGGLSFVRDRTGADLGARLSWLQKTPVDDFFLPGLFLLGVYGIGSLLLIAGLASRWSPGPVRRLNARLGHHWAWIGAIGQGGTLVTWILYEFVVLPDRMLLQPILIGVGLLMVVLALMPSMRRFYATGAQRHLGWREVSSVASTLVRESARSQQMPDRRSRGSRAPYVASAIVAVASVVASIAGLSMKDVYQDVTSWATAALRGGDLVTLVIAVPILVLAMMLAGRGSSRARLVWIGALAYAVYNFAFYVFGAAFNDLFLVHVVAFSSSIFALIVTTASLDASAIARAYRMRASVRAVAGLLILVGVVFATLWTVFSISYAVTGRLSLGAAPLEGMHTVFAIDLSLMVPGMALAGVLLWRGRPWGYVTGAAMSVFGAIYQLNLAAAGWFQWDAGVEGARRIDPVGAIFIVAFLVAAAIMIRELHAVERRTGSR